ncbi:uncharacterized protein BDV14DRAFT_198894 [Aspergillus stella-maris]|uniref:uncharacterized protein n=1 Tax=Aspergillus stella-maris TaxID=1810926 RepID=UPI003CCCA8BF
MFDMQSDDPASHVVPELLIQGMPSLMKASKAAKILEEKGVGVVFHGYLGSAFVGDGDGYQEVDFVVADDLIPDAINALISSGYQICTDQSCVESPPLHILDGCTATLDASWLVLREPIFPNNQFPPPTSSQGRFLLLVTLLPPSNPRTGPLTLPSRDRRATDMRPTAIKNKDSPLSMAHAMTYPVRTYATDPDSKLSSSDALLPLRPWPTS